MASNQSTKYLDFIVYNVYANLRAETKRLYISYLWWIINPIMEMTVFYIVFGFLLHRGIDDFVPFLLIGITSWRWMAISVIRSSNSIMANAMLINQVNIPKIILPTVNILTESLKFFISFLVLLVFLWLYGLPATLHYLALPYVLFAELLIITALSYILTAVTPFFPDIQILLQNALQLVFFLSGIFYKIDLIPAKYHFWFYLNPMATIIESLRAIFLYNQWPEFRPLNLIVGVAAFFIMIGAKILQKYEKKYPRIVLS